MQMWFVLISTTAIFSINRIHAANKTCVSVLRAQTHQFSIWVQLTHRKLMICQLDDTDSLGFSSLLSGLQIRPQRNLIWWVSKCRQPVGFYGDGTCHTVNHFPPKRMHRQHSFICHVNNNGCNFPTTQLLHHLNHHHGILCMERCTAGLKWSTAIPNFKILFE